MRGDIKKKKITVDVYYKEFNGELYPVTGKRIIFLDNKEGTKGHLKNGMQVVKIDDKWVITEKMMRGEPEPGGIYSPHSNKPLKRKNTEVGYIITYDLSGKVNRAKVAEYIAKAILGEAGAFNNPTDVVKITRRNLLSDVKSMVKAVMENKFDGNLDKTVKFFSSPKNLSNLIFLYMTGEKTPDGFISINKEDWLGVNVLIQAGIPDQKLIKTISKAVADLVSGETKGMIEEKKKLERARYVNDLIESMTKVIQGMIDELYRSGINKMLITIGESKFEIVITPDNKIVVRPVKKKVGESRRTMGKSVNLIVNTSAYNNVKGCNGKTLKELVEEYNKKTEGANISVRKEKSNTILNFPSESVFKEVTYEFACFSSPHIKQFQYEKSFISRLLGIDKVVKTKRGYVELPFTGKNKFKVVDIKGG